MLACFNYYYRIRRMRVNKKYSNIAKTLLYSVLSFYCLMAILLILIPNHKNAFTLISCLTTISTLGLCWIFSLLEFNTNHLAYNMLRTLCFGGMFGVYVTYLVVEFNIISTSFNYISLGFDLFTSLMSFLVIKDSVWSNDNPNS